MSTFLFRIDLTHDLDSLLHFARARPDRVELGAWANLCLAENTNGFDAVIVARPCILRPVEVLGPASLDAGRRWSDRRWTWGLRGLTRSGVTEGHPR